MQAGVVGLGAMGWHMAMNLAKAGFLRSVWNRSDGKTRAFSEQTGVACAASPEALARSCEVVVTCVSADADVLTVVDQLSSGLTGQSIVIDTSTVAAQTAREAARRCAEHGASFLDAPVSGGVEGARNAKLAMMIGGDEAVLERARPVLDAISARVAHMGPVGAGQATKAVNQIIAAGLNQAVTDGLAFAQAMELPLDKVIDIVGSGAAANWFLSNRGPTMVEHRFVPGFRVALHHKDLSICHEMAAAFGARLNVIERTLGDYEKLMQAGSGDEDITALFKLKEALFHAT